MTFQIVSPFCMGGGFKAPDIGSSVEYIQVDNRPNIFSPCDIYHMALAKSKTDVIMYAHDDVTVHDKGWMDAVMDAFTPGVGVVGFGGAIGLGNYDLYRKPYKLGNMARVGYRSNQTDAENHGLRISSPERVVVLDAFFMAVRTDFLRACGGWPTRHITHHCLDLWLACEAERAGLQTWVVPVSVTHHGGGTSTKSAYTAAQWLKGRSLEIDHQEPHEWLYRTYRDVLPIHL